MSEAETQPVKKKSRLQTFLPLAVIAAGFVAFFALGGQQYLSFEALRDNRQVILDWAANNAVLAVFAFIFAYYIAVMFSLPGGLVLTLVGGFVFGTVLGTLYVVVGATLGAIAIFLLARYALYDFFKSKAGSALGKMEEGFKENALSYLLVLRLVPLFPFWLVNLVPALLGVSLRTYAFGTFFGIIPGTFVYASVGSGLGAVFDRGETPNLGIIFEPQIITPIVGLAVLAMVPVIYKKIKARKAATETTDQ